MKTHTNRFWKSAAIQVLLAVCVSITLRAGDDPPIPPSQVTATSQQNVGDSIEVPAIPAPSIRVSTLPLRADPAASQRGATDSLRPTNNELVAEPSGEIIVSMALNEFRTDNLNQLHQEGAQERLGPTSSPLEQESTRSVFRHLRQRPTLRGAWDLVNPRAPITRVEAPTALAFETRKRLDYPSSRIFHDAVAHEGGLRLW